MSSSMCGQKCNSFTRAYQGLTVPNYKFISCYFLFVGGGTLLQALPTVSVIWKAKATPIRKSKIVVEGTYKLICKERSYNTSSLETDSLHLGNMKDNRRVIVVCAYVDTLVFWVSVSKSVMSINGLSFVSARPAPQPCASVFMVHGIWEIIITKQWLNNNFIRLEVSRLLH